MTEHNYVLFCYLWDDTHIPSNVYMRLITESSSIDSSVNE